MGGGTDGRVLTPHLSARGLCHKGDLPTAACTAPCTADGSGSLRWGIQPLPPMCEPHPGQRNTQPSRLLDGGAPGASLERGTGPVISLRVGDRKGTESPSFPDQSERKGEGRGGLEPWRNLGGEGVQHPQGRQKEESPSRPWWQNGRQPRSPGLSGFQSAGFQTCPSETPRLLPGTRALMAMRP